MKGQLLFIATTLVAIAGCATPRGSRRSLDPRMAFISGATFYMGTDPSEIPHLLQKFNTRREDFFRPETPSQLVELKPFHIDRFEVTNGEFKAFLKANPNWRVDRVPHRYHNGHYLEHWNNGEFPPGTANHPVTCVSWYAAFAYCEAAGKRLPTEAEWEFAARGGLLGEVFPWGESMPDATNPNWGASLASGSPGRLKAATR